MNKKGFTLIELLVVIAIIGILSGIVLTSLGTARERARIASAQASMSSMRAEAEIATDNNGTYPGTICSSSDAAGTVGAPLESLRDAVTENLSDPACRKAADVSNRTSDWAIWVALPGTPASFYCVDSSGFAGGDISSAPTGVECQ